MTSQPAVAGGRPLRSAAPLRASKIKTTQTAMPHSQMCCDMSITARITGSGLCRLRRKRMAHRSFLPQLFNWSQGLSHWSQGLSQPFGNTPCSTHQAQDVLGTPPTQEAEPEVSPPPKKVFLLAASQMDFILIHRKKSAAHPRRFYERQTEHDARPPC